MLFCIVERENAATDNDMSCKKCSAVFLFFQDKYKLARSIIVFHKQTTDRFVY